VPHVLEVRDLTKRFGANVAVDGLSFKATPGHVVGFLGPNGAGKTTTLRTPLGLTLPTSGAATVHSRPYRELEDPVKVVGAVLEGPQFHPGRTGRNHLRVLAAGAGLPARRVDEMLSLVELNGAGKRRVKGYSLGMLSGRAWPDGADGGRSGGDQPRQAGRAGLAWTS